MSDLLESIDALAGHLKAALAAPLPGVEAQLLMSPAPRRGWKPNLFPDDCRQAAVLLVTYASSDGPRLVLTQRREDLPDHPGQVSFPGGEIEGDETHVEAALREANEEVGLDPEVVEIVGRLTSLHVPVSNFVLHPVVGIARSHPHLAPEDAEVAQILEPRLTSLASHDEQGLERWQRPNSEPWVPFFHVGGLKVWGATAMVLAEFLAALGAPPAAWTPGQTSD